MPTTARRLEFCRFPFCAHTKTTNSNRTKSPEIVTYSNGTTRYRENRQQSDVQIERNSGEESEREKIRERGEENVAHSDQRIQNPSALTFVVALSNGAFWHIHPKKMIQFAVLSCFDLWPWRPFSIWFPFIATIERSIFEFERNVVVCTAN